MRIALLCSGLGHVARGHEVFARSLFDLLDGAVDMTLFKGGGDPGKRELVIPALRRGSPWLDHIHPIASPRWADAVREQERNRIEHETFAYAALAPLLEGNYDIIHCLEQEVCAVVYANRHLFRRIPRVVFSNGGAIAAPALPPCDFVQEHSSYNLARSSRQKAFMIPHGVDTERFRPGIETDFRSVHGIPSNAFVVISVGTICVNHKRMDHVIREVAPLKDAHLLIVGQEHGESPAIRELGQRLLGPRVTVTRMPHERLQEAYAAADAFVLGSLFETFGIVYIEAMAMGLPVICTRHPNQRAIVQEGMFIDMRKRGELTRVLRETSSAELHELGRRARAVAEQHYDIRLLRQKYVEMYQSIASTSASLPVTTVTARLVAHLRNAWREGLRGRYDRAP
jgi:1,2-diacylglycerol 3-alpha-glucosyltransferase